MFDHLIFNLISKQKQIIEKWFGADLKPGWVFISAVYCEKGDVWNNCCKDCDMNFVFSGTEDLVMKIEKINKNLTIRMENLKNPKGDRM